MKMPWQWFVGLGAIPPWPILARWAGADQYTQGIGLAVQCICLICCFWALAITLSRRNGRSTFFLPLTSTYSQSMYSHSQRGKTPGDPK